MVAASKRTSVRNSDDHLVAVPNYQLGSADEHSRILSRVGAAELNWPPTRCWWSGCAGGSGVVLELLQLAFSEILYHMDWLEDVYSKVGPSGVSPPVHERSHGNAHAHRLRIAWQVVGSLKRASHESIPSIHQLRE